MQVHVYQINNMSVDGHFSYNIWILLKSNNKISTLIYLQNNTDVISRYGCNGNTHVHYVDPVHVSNLTCLFIFINFMGIWFHLISSKNWSSGENGGLVIWRPLLMDRILPWTRFSVMFTCSMFLAAGMAALKWNQAWHPPLPNWITTSRFDI